MFSLRVYLGTAIFFLGKGTNRIGGYIMKLGLMVYSAKGLLFSRRLGIGLNDECPHCHAPVEELKNLREYIMENWEPPQEMVDKTMELLEDLVEEE